ncbi:MAG TPA: apolipoprotein N-acyltransferase [Marmoricola sp.]|nr:apolipoprotein N-acyltransferase [Marmoricola sp.]
MRRVLLAVASGLLAGLAFEPLGWSLLLVPAVAGLSLALRGVRGKRAFGTGLLFGAAFMGLLLPWLQVIGVDAWIGLSVLEAAFYGLLGLALVRVSTLPAWPVWAAACWVAVDALRSVVPWGGFPWGRLAFATVDTPLASAMAWVGTSGTSFLVALLGTTLAWLLVEGRGSVRTAVLATAAVVAAAALPALLPAQDQDPSGTARVAVVQGNVPGEGMDAFSERRAVLDNHVRATQELAARIDAGETERPDFVLWPENSTDIDPFQDPTVHADISGAVDAVGVPVLVGAMVTGPGPVDVRNQGIVWEPGTGPGQSYSKTHPVPFGEYIPMRAQLAQLFERLDQIPRDMVPGTEPGILDLGGTTVGDVICFEVAWDGLVHDVVEGGAELLVVQTNNATYMGTGQVEQQFAIARLRAVEAGRYVAVVATNGVSGIIAPDGSVVERAPVRETVVLEADVPLLTHVTVGIRVARWVEALLVALALGAVVVATVRSRRRRTPSRPEPSTGTAPEREPAGGTR